MTQHPQRTLKTGGLTPFTATDYPGRLAAVVFVQGCPWRCGYCHNPHLQTRTASSPLSWHDMLQFLERRRGLIDAVVFSGGEPTMDPGLINAVNAVRELNFTVGLHSAGTHPERLRQVLPLIDWIGLDIKALPGDYDAITGMPGSARPAYASLRAVLDSKAAYECRTTLHPQLHCQEQIEHLAQRLSAEGVRHYALQAFRPTGCANPQLTQASAAALLSESSLARISKLFDTFSFRSH